MIQDWRFAATINRTINNTPAVCKALREADHTIMADQLERDQRNLIRWREHSELEEPGLQRQTICPECKAPWEWVIKKTWLPTCSCCQVCNHYNQLHGKRRCPIPYTPIYADTLDPQLEGTTT